MANTLSNLIPDTYAALDVVSRELTGFIPSVLRDASADRIATGQTLRVPVVPTATLSDYTPAMAFPAAVDQTVTNVSVTLTKSRQAKFSWTGEEQYAMDRGPGYGNIKQNQIAQAIRGLVNEMETDLAALALLNASRATGTAGTNPFDTVNNYTDAANLHKILADNGAPMADKQLVISTLVGVNLRGKQATSQNATTDDILRQGVLLDIAGFKIRESAALGTVVTKGTGASYQTNGAVAAGATTIAVDTGTGTILAGDVVTIDSRNYVVKTALSGGSFTINAPGLVVAVADNTAVTLINNHAKAGVAFDRGSLLLVNRLPEMAIEGDLAAKIGISEVVTDPRTGLAFLVRAIPGDGMVTYSIHSAWGVASIKSAYSALLIG